MGLGPARVRGGRPPPGSQSFGFSGFTLPDDDSGFQPDVTLTFGYDSGCSSNCTLRIDLTYNESGNNSANSQVLTGVTFDPNGSITVNTGSSTVLAPTGSRRGS